MIDFTCELGTGNLAKMPLPADKKRSPAACVAQIWLYTAKEKKAQ
jgi:hypothetical protein